ncbi:TPA: hypothetical protein ACH3X2_002077 [Trebouxia sp. C0005]
MLDYWTARVLPPEASVVLIQLYTGEMCHQCHLVHSAAQLMPMRMHSRLQLQLHWSPSGRQQFIQKASPSLTMRMVSWLISCGVITLPRATLLRLQQQCPSRSPTNWLPTRPPPSWPLEELERLCLLFHPLLQTAVWAEERQHRPTPTSYRGELSLLHRLPLLTPLQQEAVRLEQWCPTSSLTTWLPTSPLPSRPL